MKRKWLSFLLALCMIFALAVPAMTPGACAAEVETGEGDDPGEDEPREPIVLRTTDAGIAMLKSFEGFLPTPTWDVSQYSVGYGSRCEKDDYPEGITEEEADYLLRQYVQGFEKKLDAFLNENSITVTDPQYDALVSFTYNLGSGWMNNGSVFSTMLKRGLGQYAELDVINAVAIYCHSGGKILSGLVERRLKEAMLLLYEEYDSAERIAGYCRVYFSVGSYQDCLTAGIPSVSPDIYICKKGTKLTYLPDVSCFKLTVTDEKGSVKRALTDEEAKLFAGWYTQAEDGTGVSTSTTVERNMTLFARWKTQQPSITFETVLPPEVPAGFTNPYEDIQTSYWAYPYIAVLSQEKVVNGYSDGTFRPGNNVTWGEALKLVMLAAGFPAQSNAKSGHWASDYLKAAQDYGILNPEKTVNLSAAITRREMAELAVHALWLEPTGADTPFADTDDLCVVALAAAGIVQGSVDSTTGLRNFHPASNLTRAEMAAIVWRIAEYAEPEIVG